MNNSTSYFATVKFNNQGDFYFVLEKMCVCEIVREGINSQMLRGF